MTKITENGVLCYKYFKCSLHIDQQFDRRRRRCGRGGGAGWCEGGERQRSVGVLLRLWVFWCMGGYPDLRPEADREHKSTKNWMIDDSLDI